MKGFLMMFQACNDASESLQQIADFSSRATHHRRDFFLGHIIEIIINRNLGLIGGYAIQQVCDNMHEFGVGAILGMQITITGR